VACEKYREEVLLEMVPISEHVGISDASQNMRSLLHSHQTFLVRSYEPTSEMAGFHALIVFVLMASKHCFSELLLERHHQSARFFATGQLEMIKEREVQVERIENLRLQFGLHLGQRRVRIIQCLSQISLVCSCDN
jgi:hypothetical protein